MGRLQKQLKKYEKKYLQLKKEWSSTAKGSAYGNEYLDMQLKVYEARIIDIKKEILGEK